MFANGAGIDSHPGQRSQPNSSRTRDQRYPSFESEYVAAAVSQIEQNQCETTAARLGSRMEPKAASRDLGFEWLATQNSALADGSSNRRKLAIACVAIL